VVIASSNKREFMFNPCSYELPTNVEAIYL